MKKDVFGGCGHHSGPDVARLQIHRNQAEMFQATRLELDFMSRTAAYSLNLMGMRMSGGNNQMRGSQCDG
jgi:hypothetical protein